VLHRAARTYETVSGKASVAGLAVPHLQLLALGTGYRQAVRNAKPDEVSIAAGRNLTRVPAVFDASRKRQFCMVARSDLGDSDQTRVPSALRPISGLMTDTAIPRLTGKAGSCAHLSKS
jgi:hypothetical protein